MRKALLFFCVTALMQSLAFGTVVGSWTKTTNGSTDVWTYTVTPTGGENIRCFDIWAYTNTTGQGPFLTNPNPPVAPNGSQDSYGAVDEYTHFLFNLAHGSGKSAVMDVAEIAHGVDPSDLYGSLAFAAGGAYDHRATGGVLGINTATNVLQLAVPAASDPFSINYSLPSGLNGLSMSSIDHMFPTNDVYPVWIDVGGVPHQIVPIPEPGTLALFGCGLFGVLAYAWRKRK
jgi:hypothetical protein